MFTYRLALEMRRPDVETFKREIGYEQLKKWFAFYLLEPWGQPWLMAGRMTSLIRAGFTGRFDKHDEERFLITYREGDEYRKGYQSDAEIAHQLASLPGLTTHEPDKCPRSEKSRPFSPPPPAD